MIRAMPERKRCFSADVFPKLTIKSCHCHHRHHGWRLETGNRFDRCLLLTTRIDHNPFQAASDIYKNIFGNLYHGLAVSFFRRHSGTSAPLRAVIINSPIVKVNNHCKQCHHHVIINVIVAISDNFIITCIKMGVGDRGPCNPV